MKKPKLAAVLSAIVWGAGQAYNKQWLKGLFFFLFQVILVGIEILTGNYFSGAFSFREAGFFLKGIWGAITLGTQPSMLTENGLTPGDHSIILLIEGIIAILILMVFAIIWYMNIKDAYKTAKDFDKTGESVSSREWFEYTWEHAFEYIVIIPSGLMLILFSFMPIIFAFLVGCTNYNKSHLPPSNLVEWVGLNNFLYLFSIGGGSTSANQWFTTFWNVFVWTIIFAIISTAAPFFLGLFQAVILNNKRVIGKKVWRSILILPWALPHII